MNARLASPTTSTSTSTPTSPSTLRHSTGLIWPRLTSVEPGTCRFAAGNTPVEVGLCSPAFKYSSPTLVENDSLAYLALCGPEPDATKRRFELGATDHGPLGADLAERLCVVNRTWDHERTAQPIITAYTAGTLDADLVGGQVITKRFARLMISA